MFDFKSITLGDSRYNFHSHTQFCDGRATMAEFAEAVSKAGFRHWGFSPHSPVPIDSPCNMAEYDVPIYLAEVCRLNSLYESSDIEFYTSMEIDYLGEHWGPISSSFRLTTVSDPSISYPLRIPASRLTSMAVMRVSSGRCTIIFTMISIMWSIPSSTRVWPWSGPEGSTS